MNSNHNYDFLQAIIKDKHLHAKFLNTLSFLEYTGAKKIIKSQEEKDINIEKLMHMSEEIRHALTFKKFSSKILKNNFQYIKEDVFCFDLTKNYIKYVDDYCIDLVDKKLCYPLVSYVIEIRALSLYKYYSSLLLENKCNISLKALIVEEERHLTEMKEEILSCVNPKIVDLAISFENKVFNDFKESLILEIH